jgi:hypothetical protein
MIQENKSNLFPESIGNKKSERESLILSEYELGIVFFDNREAEKRERFVQTYIILFGLLLSYNQSTQLQSIAMAFYLLFLFGIMMYYSLLNSHYWHRNLIQTYGIKGVVYLVNIIALLSVFVFSYILMMFFVIVGNGTNSLHINSSLFIICVLVSSWFLCLPLLINRSMFR